MLLPEPEKPAIPIFMSRFPYQADAPAVAARNTNIVFGGGYNDAGCIGGDQPMCDEWMPTLRLKLTQQEYEQLPRHPAYRYELMAECTLISPWPRHCHAELRLDGPTIAADAVAQFPLRSASAADIEALAPILVAAFADAQPFGSLPKADALRAAEKSLREVFAGKEGPLIEPASFVALNGEQIAGAVLITLVPGGDQGDWASHAWGEPPPPDLWQQRGGQPHLTWIFITKFSQGTGIGTRLLHESIQVLRGRRIREPVVHVPLGQRFQHALALAQRLRAGGESAVEAANAARVEGMTSEPEAPQRGFTRSAVSLGPSTWPGLLEDTNEGGHVEDRAACPAHDGSLRNAVFERRLARGFERQRKWAVSGSCP